MVSPDSPEPSVEADSSSTADTPSGTTGTAGRSSAIDDEVDGSTEITLVGTEDEEFGDAVVEFGACVGEVGTAVVDGS